MTTDLKCPFAQPLVSEEMRCEQGSIVARRAGPDASCKDQQANVRCHAVYQRLLDCMLEQLGMDEVDLNRIPHSALLKIQYGGLLGLASEVKASLPVTNIDALVKRVLVKYGEAEQIPLDLLRESIMNFKAKRRRKNKAQ